MCWTWCWETLQPRKILMNFYSVHNLRTDTKNMWKSLFSGNEIVITNNGNPSALMIDSSVRQFLYFFENPGSFAIIS